MAAVTPLPGNGCKGTHEDDTADIRLKCKKTEDDDGNPVYNCSTMRYFRVNCSKLNTQCNTLSGAWVAAITVCQQKLF